jgi:hypothetical protein
VLRLIGRSARSLDLPGGGRGLEAKPSAKRLVLGRAEFKNAVRSHYPADSE